MSKKTNVSLVGFIILPFFIFLAFQNCSPKGFTSSSSSSTGTPAPLMGAVPGVPPVLVSAVSRKAHNLVSYDVPIVISRLITDSMISVEPRVDLGAGHTVVLKFDRPVLSVQSASVVDAANQKAGEARVVLSTTDATEVGVVLTKVTNKMRVRVVLSGLNGPDVSASFAMGFLSGDINGSGMVDAADTDLANAAIGAVLTAANFKNDINLNGAVSTEDREAVRSRQTIGLVLAVPGAPAGVVCETILNHNTCQPATVGLPAVLSSMGQTDLTCQSYCAAQLLAQPNGDYCCMYTPPEGSVGGQSQCALTTFAKTASGGLFPNSAANCTRRAGGAITCPATTRTIVSAANNAGTTVSCDATLPVSTASTTPVVAMPVTNSGSYSLICQADGMWATTPSVMTCPAPANVPCPAIAKSVVSANNILGVSQTCMFNLPASTPSITAILATNPAAGTNYSLVCLANGTWAAAPAVSTCPAPAVAVASIAVPTVLYPKLSDSPFYQLSKAPQNLINLKLYIPQYPLYSDDATKKRFIYLPANTKIDTTVPDEWIYPMGTIFYKEFSIDGKKVETRVWEKTAIAQGMASWRPSVYVWKTANASGDQIDADLLTVDDFYTKPVAERQLYQAGQIETKYKMVRMAQCATCHRGSNDSALGFNYLQLSGSSLQFDIAKIASLNYFTTPPTTVDTIKGSQKARDAMGYMQSNCATCHSPRGNAGLPNYKHTSSTILYEAETILVTNNARVSTQLPLITFGDLANSLIHKRLSNRTMPGIPPIKVDALGVQLLEAWILEPQMAATAVATNCPPTTRTIVSPPNALGATQSCVATLASSAPSGIPVDAFSVTNGGSYSLVCTSTGGQWATAASVAICKEPALAPPQISMEIGGIGVDNSYSISKSYTFKVLSSRVLTSDLTIPLVPGRIGDTALNNLDYNLEASVTIKAGDSSATFQMVIIKDLPDEVYPAPASGNTYSNKFFYIGLKPSTNSSYTLLGSGDFQVALWKTDVPPIVSTATASCNAMTTPYMCMIPNASTPFLASQSGTINSAADCASWCKLQISYDFYSNGNYCCGYIPKEVTTNNMSICALSGAGAVPTLISQPPVNAAAACKKQ